MWRITPFGWPHAARFEPAGPRNDRLGFRVVDAHGKFGRRKATEDDRMHRADPGHSEHGDERLCHHGHVDDDAVALRHAPRGKATGHAGHAVLKLGVADPGFSARDRAVVDDRGLVAATLFHMTVHRVVASVDHAVGEPFVEVVAKVEERLGRGPVPGDGLRGLHPKPLGIGFPALIDILVGRHGWSSSSHGCARFTWGGRGGATVFAVTCGGMKREFAISLGSALQIFANASGVRRFSE